MISSTTNRIAYQGDGSSASFAFQFEFHAPADLDVYIWNSSRAVATVPQVLNTNYSISGVADAQNRYTNGALVVFNSTPANGDNIIIVRDLAPTNPFNLRFNQIIPNAELTKALDRFTLIEQRLTDLTGRSVRLADSFPLAFDATMPDILPKYGPLIVSSSGQRIDIGVVSVQGSSAATYFGILPLNNGGTGLDLSQLVGIPYSPGGGASTAGRIQNGPEGFLLTSHGSSAPTFDALSASIINSGIVTVDHGGTGSEDLLTPRGVIVASSATRMFSTGAGGQDQPLVGNATGVPSFRALNLQSASSVTSILRQLNGGTGTASSFPQFAVIYQSGASTYGAVPSAADGRVLTAHGSSAPSFDVSTPTPVAPLPITGATVLTTANQVVLASSSNYNITLYDVNGNEGRIVEIVRETEALGQPINILGSAAQISTTLDTAGEVLRVQARAGSWKILSRVIPSVWTAWVPTGSWVANTTYSGFYRRTRDSIDLDIFIALAGAPTTAPLHVNTPVTLDANKFSFRGPALATVNSIVRHWDSSAVLIYRGSMAYNSTTAITAIADQADANTGTTTATNPFTFANGDFISIKVYGLPVASWNG